MDSGLFILCIAAAGTGLIHTIIGPDHYVPFVMIGRARGWSLKKLAVITALCGLGHVLSSVFIGLAGIAIGIAVGRLESLEAFRGNLASWLLIGFGLAYGIWGIRRGLRSKTHAHMHSHDGIMHEHDHSHLDSAHAHLHDTSGEKKSITVWTLFIIFVLGPCEPLIPLLMYPAAKESFYGVLAVSAVFAVVTVSTMTLMALFLYSGFRMISSEWLNRYVHAASGFVIALSGGAITLLGI